ncbi:MAG: nicotinate (nicotinamide) nucleotide adenylyltransferase [Oscillospiraceae bacterium]|nr:nicotinate (nicotinamide) nucleotide adenylyltransferase [Oscillospiraceae bacterium]
MHETIIVMGGSFNPPTIAHQALLLTAVEAMGANRGIFVPSSHTYVSIKMRRAKHPKEVLPEQIRLEMLEAMAADDPRLEVDDCEFHRTEKAYTYETMESIQERYPDAELYFLAGGDKVSPISRWHRISEFLDRFRILIVRRDGDDPETALNENPFLSRHLDRFRIIPAPGGLEGISSSAVREKLCLGEPANDLLHPKVREILQRNGGIRK